MTNKSHKTYKTYMQNVKTKKTGGYESLLVYQQSVVILDLTELFCNQYLSAIKYQRDVCQMRHAARSGKQNIVEGSLENSVEGNLKLTGVARASYGELLEDYKDFLRRNSLSVWQKDDPRVITIRKIRPYKTNKANETYRSYAFHMKNPEEFANLVITLCYIQGYMLDQMLKAIERRFIQEGGFREKLFQKRREFKMR